jgi:hypothetical protein
MTNILKTKKKLKKKVRALEKKIKNIEIAESPEKKRKLSLKNGESGKEREKESEKNYPYPSKFAAIKKDLRSIIRNKRDFYNTLFIRFGFFER